MYYDIIKNYHKNILCTTNEQVTTVLNNLAEHDMKDLDGDIITTSWVRAWHVLHVTTERPVLIMCEQEDGTQFPEDTTSFNINLVYIRECKNKVRFDEVPIVRSVYFKAFVDGENAILCTRMVDVIKVLEELDMHGLTIHQDKPLLATFKSYYGNRKVTTDSPMLIARKDDFDSNGNHIVTIYSDWHSGKLSRRALNIRKFEDIQ